jgi:uncharacterized protein (DUF1800 family)
MAPTSLRPFCNRLALTLAATGVLALPLPAGDIAARQDAALTEATDARAVAHVLNRLGFGPRPGDVERVQRIGLAAYIEEQLHPERIDDSALQARLATFETLSLSTRDLMERYFAPALELRREQQQQQARQAQRDQQAAAARQTPPSPENADPAMMAPEPPAPAAPAQPNAAARQAAAQQAAVMNELMQARVLRAALSERQLEEVLVDFWFNHFNVFVGKGQVRQYLTEYERDAIRPYVFGRFRDMLGATATSPAMLFYLDNFQSRTATPSLVVGPEIERRLNDPRLSPQQREQLLRRLQQQRARQPQRPQGGLNENYARELMELHTLGVDGGYTQQDVVEVARILTGWTIDQPRQGGGFVFRPAMHDTGEKTVLGVRFPAGRGQDEGERLLDMLAEHPSTARHIAFKLAQRFVADEPPAALVERVAQVFLDTKGDLRAVTRAVVTSPEFFSPDAHRAKVKTPLEFTISALRATNADIVTAQPVVAALRELGMPLYGAQPPTGYSMTADAWVNTGALLARMNLALQLVEGGVPVRGGRAGGADARPGAAAAGRPARARAAARGPIRIDVAALAPDASASSQDRLIAALLAGDASDATRETLGRAETPQQLVALALGSPEFQRR